MILSTLLGGRDERKGEKHPPLRFARPTCLWLTIDWCGDILL